ncbi:bifunctional oligoribonuclease/PAP phosphatase NrnA [Elusimicrobiota bacterium]
MSEDMANPILEFLALRAKTLSPLLILTHDHPDPDAMASAWALAFLAERLHKIRTRIAYGGIIGRMENQMMVRILRVPVCHFSPQDLFHYKNVALVDTQPPFQNNRYPSYREAAIIIDHHPKHPNTKGSLVLIDETSGATATMLTEALMAADLAIPPKLATALAYGIGSETQNLSREAGPRDVAAHAALLPRVNMRSLQHIQNPPRPGSFFLTLGRAIQNAFMLKNIIGVHLCQVDIPDIVSHMADFLLTHEKTRWSIVTGRYEGSLLVSLRTRNQDAGAGKLLWRLLGRKTSAGGHKMIAGGSIYVGENADEQAWRRQEEKLLFAFLHALGYSKTEELRYPYYAAGQPQAAAQASRQDINGGSGNADNSSSL